jgi:hypothetical protein
MYAMHVNRAKVISCPIQNLLVCPVVLWILFFPMFGNLPRPLLVDIPTMLVSLMIILNSLGFIS